MKRFLRVFTVWVILFSLMYTGIIYFMLKDNNDSGFLSQEGEDKGSDKTLKDEITVLLLGVDANDLTEEKGQRTDTIMLCRYDTISGDISVLSIPRDTRTVIRGKNRADKINHAHAYGGPELTVKTVKDLLGIEPDYYVKVDYKVVEEFVDIIGGVEVDVPMDMVYHDPTADPPLHINLKRGKQTLDGQKALQFLRFRKGYANQDLGRIQAQQQFIKATIQQSLKPINILKLPKIVKKLYENVDTNITLDVAIKFIPEVRNINLDNITMATLPGTSKLINGIWYYIPDKQKTAEIVNNLFINSQVAKN